MKKQIGKKAMLAEVQTFELLGVQSRADAYRLSTIARKLHNISVRRWEGLHNYILDQHLQANANDLVWQANALLGDTGYTVMYSYNKAVAFYLIEDAFKKYKAYRAAGGTYTFAGYWFTEHENDGIALVMATEEDCK